MTERSECNFQRYAAAMPIRFRKATGVRLPSDLDRFIVIFDNLACQFDDEEDFEESNPSVTLTIY